MDLSFVHKCMKTYQEFKNQRLVESMPNLPDASDQQYMAASQEEDRHNIQTLHRQIQGEFEHIFSFANSGQFAAASQVNQAMNKLTTLIIALNDARSD